MSNWWIDEQFMVNGLLGVARRMMECRIERGLPYGELWYDRGCGNIRWNVWIVGEYLYASPVINGESIDYLLVEYRSKEYKWRLVSRWVFCDVRGFLIRLVNFATHSPKTKVT